MRTSARGTRFQQMKQSKQIHPGVCTHRVKGKHQTAEQGLGKPKDGKTSKEVHQGVGKTVTALPFVLSNWFGVEVQLRVIT